MAMFNWIRDLLKEPPLPPVGSPADVWRRRLARGLPPPSDSEKRQFLLKIQIGDPDAVASALDLGMPMDASYKFFSNRDPAIPNKSPFNEVRGSPLNYLIEECSYRIDKRLAVAKLLVAYGADARQPSYVDGNSLVVRAADEPELLRYLVACGADINHKNALGEVPVATVALRTAEKRHLDGAALHNLVEAGADINGVDPSTLSPIARVASSGKRSACETVKLMLELGADPLRRDADGRNACDVATQDCAAFLHAWAARHHLGSMLAAVQRQATRSP